MRYIHRTLLVHVHIVLSNLFNKEILVTYKTNTEAAIELNQPTLAFRLRALHTPSIERVMSRRRVRNKLVEDDIVWELGSIS